MEIKVFDKHKAAELLSSESTFAFVLLSIVLNMYTGDDDEFPDEYVDEPALLFKAIEEDLHIRIPEENENKINAALTVLTTDLFYTNYHVFNHVAQTFALGDPGDLNDDNELDACKCMWAIVEAGLISDVSMEDANDTFSKHVIDKINDIVDNEAEDKDAQLEDFEGDELDTMEEALAENYYQRYLTCNLLEMAKQLLKLGVDTKLVGEMIGKFGRSLDKVEQEAKNVSAD